MDIIQPTTNPFNTDDDILLSHSPYPFHPPIREIAFVDSQLYNYQTLIEKLDANIHAIALDSNYHGITQITDKLRNYSDLDAIHIFSHGQPGGVQLGSAFLSQDNLWNYENSLRTWGEALRPQGDLLFYGCNVAAGELGESFVQNISQITGADVAASDNLTGNASLGGDWLLEFQTAEVASIFNPETLTQTLSSYSGLLLPQPSYNNDSTNTIITLTNLGDKLKLTTDNTGKLTLIDIGEIPTFATISFDKPSESLTIDTLDGDDEIIIDSSIELGSAHLIVRGEKISLNTSGKITTTGNITFSAVANLAAEITRAQINLAGEITAGNFTGITQTEGTLISDIINTSEQATIHLDNATLNVSNLDLQVIREGNYLSSAILGTNTINGLATVNIGNSNIIATNNINIVAQENITLTAENQGISINNHFHGQVEIGISNSGIQSGALTVKAESNANIKAQALQVVNQITGDIQAYITDSNNIILGNGGLSLIAQDNSKATAISPGMSIDINTGLGQLGFTGSATVNTLNRTTQAYIQNSDITVNGGDINVKAQKNQQAIANTPATQISDNSSQSPLISVNIQLDGTYSANSILGDTRAYIEDSTLETVNTGDIVIQAQDTSIIDATAQISAFAESESLVPVDGFGLGTSIAFNAIGWVSDWFNKTLDDLIGTSVGITEESADVQAYLKNVTITVADDLSILATSAAQINATVSNAAESTASSVYGASSMASSGILASNKVSTTVAAYIDSLVDSGVIGGKTDITAQDNIGIYSNSKIVSSSITTNDGGAALLQGGINNLIKADYNSNEGQRTLKFGERVREATTGKVYEYLGLNNTSIDLSTADYSDYGDWKPVTGTEIIPQGNNISDSDATAAGGLVVTNQVSGKVESYIKNSTLTTTQLSIQSIENASITAKIDSSITASGGSAYGTGTVIAVNGTLAVNEILSQAQAYISNSNINSSGDITVAASNTSQIEAENKSASTSGDKAVGVTVAFNTIGWEPQNIFAGTLDALLGSAILGTAKTAQVKAYIEKSTVTATGNLTLTAQSQQQITALVSNEATSAASALIEATGMATSGILASNLINSNAQAYIDNTQQTGKIQVTGSIDIASLDKSHINADTKVIASSNTSNDGGVGIRNNLGKQLLEEYKYTSNSGSKQLKFGDQVRLARDYAEDKGIAGQVYQYMGTAATIDLGTQDYTNYALWKALNNINILPAGLNISDSDAMGVGGLVVRNDVRSQVSSYIHNGDVKGSSLSISAQDSSQITALAETTASASGGSSYGSGTVIAASGTIATNTVVSETTAYITNSKIETSTGDITLEGISDGQINATIFTNATSGDTAAGVTLAFNTIGWQPQNILSNSLDALLGDSVLGTAKPFTVKAYIQDSSITAAGNLTLLADSTAQITAKVSNQAESAASALINASGMALSITHIFLNNVETFMWQGFQRLKISVLLTKCTLLFLIKPLFY
ncbi:DUF4347 domain-containing protein [Anabaenopsis elenkinii]|uniref:DUF4347 domain-containing protein n=1 Tax=Anabaenopsis elenkinii CCIBt3563 TaxID=2779889 RepID=A0A7S6U598_9CYAN|nr:DUF4347 domain-containing protein [Anabaenopsis elenkinii]QOV24151.1 DUF4347 domain-containing protein [Anabaenopsis elenkinii CCIBt3563]